MLKIDLHIHTVHSGHAYATIYEIMRYARSKGLDMIAITDHGPAAGHVSHVHFNMGTRAPKSHEGMKILWGCEANIIDCEGRIDIDDKILKKLDFVLVNFHPDTSYNDLGKEKNTESLIRCFRRYPVHCFSHPATLYYKYDVEKACQAACENDVLLELNLTNLVRLEKGSKSMALDDYKTIIDVAKKNKKKILINSDAHFLHEIGDDSVLERFWDRLGLDDNIIINNFPDELNEFIGKINKKKRQKA